ncbi:MAG: four helix bundle protein [Nanoarchaeota archaeon]|nr:four helix bundle protein [Nanoarchaeota archaeon]
MLEFIFRACFAGDRFEKLSFVSLALTKNDLIKFFLQISWEQKIVDNTQYGKLILLLDEIGRQLYGWKKDTQEKL